MSPYDYALGAFVMLFSLVFLLCIVFLVVYLPFNVLRPKASLKRRVVSLVALNGLAFFLALGNIGSLPVLDAPAAFTVLLDLCALCVASVAGVNALYRKVERAFSR